MKKIFYILFIVVLLAGLQSYAVVTERKINRPGANSVQKPAATSSTAKTDPMAANLKTCKPYSETMKADYLGMNVNYKITIAGWVNNKCRLDFIAETSGVSSSFSSIYGLDPSDATVSAFVPKIRCEFTKQQLDYVGDSILQENERNAGAKNNMLKDPNSVNLQGLSSANDADARLLEVVVGSNACQILNGGDLGNMIQNLMGY